MFVVVDDEYNVVRVVDDKYNVVRLMGGETIIDIRQWAIEGSCEFGVKMTLQGRLC